uniref:arf-GAP with SH3 domain, ANK repeat and PH domain-containing protein 1-like isoform X1 n=2 Tax=Myxine glutinosa TaxID=7769 RepID=UPI00358F0F9D
MYTDAGITIEDFIQETLEDHQAPTVSNFSAHLGECRHTINNLEEVSLYEDLDSDRTHLQKMKKHLKNLFTSGKGYVDNQELFSQALESFGNTFLEEEPLLGSVFLKFSVLTKELTALLKALIRNMNNIITFPLDNLLKGDLKDLKGDMRKPFDKAWKDYETKFSKIEKEKREVAKQYNMTRGEILGAEVAEEMQKERRLFQLHMCEYLIKANDIKSKKGVDFLQNLIKYYHTELCFFQDSLKTVENMKGNIEDLTTQLNTVKQTQDEEKRKLSNLKDNLRSALQMEQKEDGPYKQVRSYSLHQLQGNKLYGSEMNGFLNKRSDGLRKAWQKRKCEAKTGFLTITRSTSSRSPIKVNLLTCQVKPSVEDKRCFTVISYDRTFHFQAEDEQSRAAWVSVITNNKEEAMNAAFRGEPRKSGDSGVLDLTRSIIRDVVQMPGNNVCCDCSSPEPSWLSTNLGVLVCIECSGLHREMGVHTSRIQSLTLDVLNTSELLISKNVGNFNFNNIFEAQLPSGNVKPTAASDMTVRKAYIVAKYTEHRYVKKRSDTLAKELDTLYLAISTKDIFPLLELFAHGVDLSEPLPDDCVQEQGETPLHVAVRDSDITSLHIADFLVQNCRNLNKQTVKGHTALHFSCEHDKPNCLKLLLRSKAAMNIENAAGEKAVDIARKLNLVLCEDLLVKAEEGKMSSGLQVEYDWHLNSEELAESEDDLDENILQRSVHRPKSVAVHPSEKTGKESRRATLSYFASPEVACSSPGETETNKKPHPSPNRSSHKRTMSEPQNTLINHLKNSQDSDASSNLDSSSAGSKMPFLENKLQIIQEAPPLSRKPHIQGVRVYPANKPGPVTLKTVDTSQSFLKQQQPPLPPKPNGKARVTQQCNKQLLPSPAPRRFLPTPKKRVRAKACYSHMGVHSDELTFAGGEIIVVTADDDSWWKGYIEEEPQRRGVFPKSFVNVIEE